MMKKTALAVALLATVIIAASCRSQDSEQISPPTVAPAVQYSDIAFGPYVNSVDQTSAEVHWVTREGQHQPMHLIAMTRKGWLLDVRSDETMHREVPTATAIPDRSEVLQTVRLTGLEPGQRYNYTIFTGRDAISGTFRTALPPDSAEPVRFLAYGDTRTEAERHALVAAAMAREEFFDLVLNTGDLVANGTDWAQWKDQFFDPAQSLLSKAAMWPARGNHEMDAVLYRQLFDLPGNGLYYSFDFGNVHFVVLDPYIGEDQHPAMLQWLEQDLAAASKRSQWIIMNYHEPTFNIGGHGSTWGRDDVLPIMEKYGVDMVINGHSHLYERFLPIASPAAKPIMHVVAGGGGAPNYPSRPSPLLVKSSSELHYCVVEVRGNRLEMIVRRPDGSELDRFELIKTEGRYQPKLMAETVDLAHARRVAFLYARMPGDYVDVPIPGARISVIVPSTAFPGGSKIRISQASKSAWKVSPVEGVGQTDPMILRVTPPEDLRLRVGGFSPLLTVKLEAEIDGKSYSYDGVPVNPTPETVRRLTPEPVAVDVPHASRQITVDGLLEDWADVPYVMVPTTGRRSSITRIAWRDDGLYVAMDVEDDEIKTSEKSAWTADGVEVFIESDYARSGDAMRKRNRAAMKFDVSPTGDPQAAQTNISYGRLTPETTAAAWQKTDKGYTLEFHVSQAALLGAKMEPGTKIGFHYVLRNDGETVEQFADIAGKSGVWRAPITWWAIRLDTE